MKENKRSNPSGVLNRSDKGSVIKSIVTNHGFKLILLSVFLIIMLLVYSIINLNPVLSHINIKLYSGSNAFENFEVKLSNHTIGEQLSIRSYYRKLKNQGE